MLSPVDARTLSTGQMARDKLGRVYFKLGRAKTGRAAAGTLTNWSEALLRAYIADLEQRGIKLLDNDQLFRTAGTEPGPRGGPRWLPQPYTTDTLAKDFRKVRGEISRDETRQIQDMRRSGAVEADAGGSTDTDLSNKMANSISASSTRATDARLTGLYVLRSLFDARQRGRKELGTKTETTDVKPERISKKSVTGVAKKL